MAIRQLLRQIILPHAVFVQREQVIHEANQRDARRVVIGFRFRRTLARNLCRLFDIRPTLPERIIRQARIGNQHRRLKSSALTCRAFVRVIVIPRSIEIGLRVNSRRIGL